MGTRTIHPNDRCTDDARSSRVGDSRRRSGARPRLASRGRLRRACSRPESRARTRPRGPRSRGHGSPARESTRHHGHVPLRDERALRTPGRLGRRPGDAPARGSRGGAGTRPGERALRRAEPHLARGCPRTSIRQRRRVAEPRALHVLPESPTACASAARDRRSARQHHATPRRGRAVAFRRRDHRDPARTRFAAAVAAAGRGPGGADARRLGRAAAPGVARRTRVPHRQVLAVVRHLRRDPDRFDRRSARPLRPARRIPPLRGEARGGRRARGAPACPAAGRAPRRLRVLAVRPPLPGSRRSRVPRARGRSARVRRDRRDALRVAGHRHRRERALPQGLANGDAGRRRVDPARVPGREDLPRRDGPDLRCECALAADHAAARVVDGRRRGLLLRRQGHRRELLRLGGGDPRPALRHRTIGW